MSSGAPCDFTACARLVSIDHDASNQRFYSLTWQPSLFGGGAIIRRWGSAGTEGRRQTEFFESREDAQETVTTVLKRRLAQGYSVVDWE